MNVPVKKSDLPQTPYETAKSRITADDNRLGDGVERVAPSVMPAPLPRQPAHSPWASNPVPPEPPLGDAGCGNTVGVALGGASPQTEEQDR